MHICKKFVSYKKKEGGGRIVVLVKLKIRIKADTLKQKYMKLVVYIFFNLKIKHNKM